MKIKLRKKFLNLRKKRYFELSDDQKSFVVKKIFNVCKNHKRKVLGIYYPINYEMNLIKVANILKKKKIQVALPVVETGNRMNFRAWNDYEPLFVNKFGILEPDIKNKKIVPQVIIVPLLSYDDQKNRLGYGRGYYDRFLSKTSNKKNIISIGMAFSFQKSKKIPVEKHDKQLDYILNEKELIS